MGRESSCIANRTLSRQKEGVSGGNTRGGSKSLLSCITLYTQQKSEANMARLAVALALAAGAQAFMAPVTTQPAKTVVYGKGGELRDRTNQCGILGSCRPLSRPRCTGRWLQQQALQPSSWLSNCDAKKRPLRDKTPAAPRPPKRKKIKSHPRAS